MCMGGTEPDSSTYTSPRRWSKKRNTDVRSYDTFHHVEAVPTRILSTTLDLTFTMLGRTEFHTAAAPSLLTLARLHACWYNPPLFHRLLCCYRPLVPNKQCPVNSANSVLHLHYPPPPHTQPPTFFHCCCTLHYESLIF